jgi:ABC-2 type transport system permease protein
MSVLSLPSHRSGQLSAIAYLRWHMFFNSLRTTRGKLEFASRVLISIGFAFGGLGGAIGAGIGAYLCISHGRAEWLALILWLIFAFWQLFPIAATAFTNNPDSSDLLRFPLTYSSYFLIRVAYGFFDPAAALGSLWLIGISVGIAIAQQTLLPWAVLTLFLFAVFNLVLTLTIFSWIERWLAQRRTREILGILFILLTLSFQLIGPMMEHFGKRSRPGTQKIFETLVPVQRAMPPGMAAAAIAAMSKAAVLPAFKFFLLLAGVAVFVGLLLHLRLKAQFHGENLSEVPAQKQIKPGERTQIGWKLSGLSPPVAAILEKEVHYLMRSGPMLLTLVMPIFMLVVFRLGPLSTMRHGGGYATRAPELAFPVAGAYALLTLTNLIYNSFGADGGGIQFFYASPVHFREIVLAKNIAAAGILIFNTMLAWAAVAYLYRAPALDVTIATVTGLLFAVPLNFAVGNLLSIYAPKKRDFASFGRQNASQTTVFVSLGLQAVIAAVGVGAFLLAHYYKNFFIAAAVFLPFAGISIAVYVFSLGRVDRVALNRRETLMAELCRA